MKHSLLFRVFLTLTTILVCCTTNAQITWQLKEKIDSLHHLGIDTILFYRPTWSPTTNEVNDTCIVHEKKYLLWRQRGEISILKEFYCISVVTNTGYRQVHTTRQKDSLAIFNYLTSSFNSIVNDKMLKALLRLSKNEKEQIKDFNKIEVNDDAYTVIFIIIGDKTYENGFSDNDLNDGTIRNVNGSTREVWESLNYDTNKRKDIYKIITKIKAQILILEKSKTI